MNYNGRDYVSIKFLESHSLFKDASHFFKMAPISEKLKVVPTAFYTDLLELKRRAEMLEGEGAVISPMLVGWDKVTPTDPTESEELEPVYQNFVSTEYIKSGKWAKHNG